MLKPSEEKQPYIGLVDLQNDSIKQRVKVKKAFQNIITKKKPSKDKQFDKIKELTKVIKKFQQENKEKTYETKQIIKPVLDTNIINGRKYNELLKTTIRRDMNVNGGATLNFNTKKFDICNFEAKNRLNKEQREKNLVSENEFWILNNKADDIETYKCEKVLDQPMWKNRLNFIEKEALLKNVEETYMNSGNRSILDLPRARLQLKNNGKYGDIKILKQKYARGMGTQDYVSGQFSTFKIKPTENNKKLFSQSYSMTRNTFEDSDKNMNGIENEKYNQKLDSNNATCVRHLLTGSSEDILDNTHSYGMYNNNKRKKQWKKIEILEAKKILENTSNSVLSKSPARANLSLRKILENQSDHDSSLEINIDQREINLNSQSKNQDSIEYEDYNSTDKVMNNSSSNNLDENSTDFRVLNINIPVLMEDMDVIKKYGVVNTLQTENSSSFIKKNIGDCQPSIISKARKNENEKLNLTRTKKQATIKKKQIKIPKDKSDNTISFQHNPKMQLKNNIVKGRQNYENEFVSKRHHVQNRTFEVRQSVNFFILINYRVFHLRILTINLFINLTDSRTTWQIHITTIL